MHEDIFENGEIRRVGKLAGKTRDNQDGFLPPGMKPELGSQLPSILPHYVEGADAAAFLREIGNGRTPYSNETICIGSC